MNMFKLVTSRDVSPAIVKQRLWPRLPPVWAHHPFYHQSGRITSPRNIKEQPLWPISTLTSSTASILESLHRITEITFLKVQSLPSRSFDNAFFTVLRHWIQGLNYIGSRIWTWTRKLAVKKHSAFDLILRCLHGITSPIKRTLPQGSKVMLG